MCIEGARWRAKKMYISWIEEKEGGYTPGGLTQVGTLLPSTPIRVSVVGEQATPNNIYTPSYPN